MEQVNSLYLDAELLEDDLRTILKSSLKNSEITNHFGSPIYVIPMNVDFTPKTKLPAVSIDVQKNGVYTGTQEDIQVEPFSRFDVIIETYTSGDDKRRKNKQLSQLVANILQTGQQLNNYYNRGLRLEQDRELSSIVDGVNRRVVRFSAITDNRLKLILNKF